MELRVSVMLVQKHLLSKWGNLLHKCSSFNNWAAWLLSPLICPVSAASFHNADLDMANIVHKACGNHPKLFVA